MERRPVMLFDTVSGDIELMFVSPKTVHLSGTCDTRNFCVELDMYAMLNIIMIHHNKNELLPVYHKHDFDRLMSHKLQQDALAHMIYREAKKHKNTRHQQCTQPSRLRITSR